MSKHNHYLLQQRAELCNETIRIIGNYGLRLFYSEPHDRYAKVEVDKRERILWVDESTGQRITPDLSDRGSRWPGFSHGATLQSLAARLCGYVSSGEQVHACLLGPRRAFTAGNIAGADGNGPRARRGPARFHPGVVSRMNRPTYCRTSGERIGSCKCLRCQPAHQGKTKENRE